MFDKKSGGVTIEMCKIGECVSMKKKLKIIIGLVGLLVVIVAITYAVWFRQFKQTGINKNVYEYMIVTLN